VNEDMLLKYPPLHREEREKKQEYLKVIVIYIVEINQALKGDKKFLKKDGSNEDPAFVVIMKPSFLQTSLLSLNMVK
jgi:hypothetical protein